MDRIHITYRSLGMQRETDVELPLQVLLIGDFTLYSDPRPLEDRLPIRIDRESFQDAMKNFGLRLIFPVPDHLSKVQGGELEVHLLLKSLEDFGPDRIVQQVPELKRVHEARMALTALKGPLGNVPQFRRRIWAIWKDTTLRAKLGEELETLSAMGSWDHDPPRDGSDSTLRVILGELRIEPTSDAWELAQRGLKALLDWSSTTFIGPEIDREDIELLIKEIDRRLSNQVDQILHAPLFQQLESAWRGLWFLLSRTNFGENISIWILNCSKDDLLVDFEDSPTIGKSGLYRHVITREYGQFGGKPYAAIFASFAIGPGPRDMFLAQHSAAIGALANAPFFAAASPEFFFLDDYRALGGLKDLRTTLEGPHTTHWQSFRDTNDARYMGLLLPRFLLRSPYGDAFALRARSFSYRETVENHEDHLWGNPSFAFAIRVVESFARYRWCANIIGPQDGAVDDIPLYQFEAHAEIQTVGPTETLISERREYELSEGGFIPLLTRKDTDNACFFSAHSCARPKFFGRSPEAKEAELHHGLIIQMPYLFMICRFVHYLRIIPREHVGAWHDTGDIEKRLNQWIGQYVADMDAVSPAVRSRRPLRSARIALTESSETPGSRRMVVSIRPHFKYMGAFFTLTTECALEA
jgi:type VI secretion system protein ImpC